MLETVVCENEESLCRRVGDYIHDVLKSKTAAGAKVSVGVSGGSMPSQICPSLRGFQDVRWDLIHFFYCDERLVPLTHKDSTHRLYEDLLYSKINIPRDNIHIVDTSLPANVAAGDYADKMFSFFSPSDGFPCFDLLLLGIGPDGHTCSLFPDHALLHVTDVCVAPIMDSPKPPPQRVTLTLPVLNKAKRVVFIASGIGKSEVIHHILTSPPTSLLPCSLVQPVDGELVWYLDKEAASKVPPTVLKQH